MPNPYQRLTFNVTPAFYTKYAHLAVDAGLSKTALLSTLVEHYIKTIQPVQLPSQRVGIQTTNSAHVSHTDSSFVKDTQLTYSHPKNTDTQPSNTSHFSVTPDQSTPPSFHSNLSQTSSYLNTASQPSYPPPPPQPQVAPRPQNSPYYMPGFNPPPMPQSVTHTQQPHHSWAIPMLDDTPMVHHEPFKTVQEAEAWFANLTPEQQTYFLKEETAGVNPVGDPKFTAESWNLMRNGYDF